MGDFFVLRNGAVVRPEHMGDDVLRATIEDIHAGRLCTVGEADRERWLARFYDEVDRRFVGCV